MHDDHKKLRNDCSWPLPCIAMDILLHEYLEIKFKFYRFHSFTNEIQIINEEIIEYALSSWIWFEITFQLVFPFNDFLAVWHINLRMHFSWCTFPKFQGSLNKLSFISNSLWISSANSPLKQQQEMQPALKCLIFNPIYPKKAVFFVFPSQQPQNTAGSSV